MSAPSSDAVRVWGATCGFLVLWVVVYGGASALSGLVPWRVPLALPGEEHLPLVTAFAWPYLSMGALLLLAPVVLRTWREVWPLFAVLVAETLVAAVIFVLLPARAEPWIDVAPDGLAMALADRMNLDRNFFPSLHVTYALTAAHAIARRSGWALGLFVWGWAALIALSTVLLRQHYVLDVVGGVLLTVLAWRSVGRWAERA